ncbi:MAG TPA: Hsp70 family protein, partial [Acidimicrobiales bacterium]|nr:Hsp70 family protein [Acidimicrobiales bacterium]
MSYALGVDIGTTFSAAAVHRQGRAEMVALGYRSALVPSAVLINAEGGTLVGDAALRRGRSEPERLARFFKRRIGDSVPLIVGGSPFSAEQLTARLLRAVVDAVAEQQGGAPDAIALTRPANWGPFKQDRFDQAIRLADLRGVTVLTEPEAAALAYAAEERVEPGAVVAVYDLGGGTFDATLLRRAGDRFEVIGEPEGIERLGGIDFDAAVFEHVRRSLDGAIEALPEDDPNTLRAIARLRDDCIDAKEALSSDTQVSIPVVLPRLATEIRLTRSELEGMIRPVLDDSIASLRRAVASADVTAAQVDRVLLVGGSSRVPLVAQLVASAFGRPVALDAHPKHAVALGAALVAGGGGADARAIGATAAQPVIATPAGLATPASDTPSRPGAPGAGTPAVPGAPDAAGTPAGAGAPGGAGAGAIATGLAAGAAAGAAASGAPITAPPAPFTPEPTPDPRPAAAGKAGAPTSDPSEAPFAPVWLSGDPAEGGAGAGTAPAARTTADGSLPPRPATPPSGTGGPSGEWAPPNGRTGGPAGEPSGEWAPPTDRAGAAPSGDAIPAAGSVGPIGDEPTRVDMGDAWAAPTARHDQPSGDRWPAKGGDEPTRVESDRTLVRPSAPGGPGDGPSGDRWAPPPAGRGDEPRDGGPSRPGVGAGAAAGMAAAGAAGVAAGGPSEMALASAGTDLGARPRYGREATPGGPGGPGSGEYVPGHASGYAGDDGPRKRRLVPLVGAIAAVGLIGAAAAVALSGGDDPEDTGSETTSDTSADTTGDTTPTTAPPVQLPSALSLGAELT